MNEKRLVPKKRFKEFQNTDAWEQRRLEEISDIRTGPFGSTLHAKDYVEEGTPIITTEHFKTGDLPEQKYGIPQVSAEDLLRLQSYVLKTDDIVFSRVGSVDINALVTPFQSGWLFSGRVLRVRTDNNVDSQYMHYELSTSRAKNDVIARAVGQTMPSINTEILKQTKVFIPIEIKEQKQIGVFLANLDHLITLHQRKLEKTKALKSAYLAEMFPAEGERVPKRRFAGYQDLWKEYNWSETVDISTDMVDPRKEKYDELFHVGPGNIESFSGKILDNVKKVKEEKLISGKFCFKPGDIIYGKINPQLAKYALADMEGLASADAYILNARNGVSQDFFFTILQSKDFYKYSVSVSSRTGMPKINRDELNQYQYFAPSLKEQQAIGEFFKKLDDSITNQQQKLNKLKAMKQAYLEEMFV